MLPKLEANCRQGMYTAWGDQISINLQTPWNAHEMPMKSMETILLEDLLKDLEIDLLKACRAKGEVQAVQAFHHLRKSRRGGVNRSEP